MGGETRLSRTLLLVLGTSATAALPVLLLGGLSVLVRADLHFGAFQLGLAIGSFFVASAATSLLAGLVSERHGPRRSMTIGLAGSGMALLGVAAVASSWWMLLPWLLMAGLANSFSQVGANHLLAIGVRTTRQGVAYGIKQSAIPLAGMVAGLALPTIGLTVGWRWAYAAASGVAVAVMVAVGRGSGAAPRRSALDRSGDARISALAVLAIGGGLGTAAANSLTGFVVLSSVDAGMGPGLAGILLTVGSLLGISARVASGWLADRLQRGSLAIAAGLLCAAAVGYEGLGLAAGNEVWILAATAVAFFGGLGYQGLVLLAVARSNPNAPAAAMAILRIGTGTGAVLGPIAFGALAEHGGFDLAWNLVGLAALLAALLVWSARYTLGGNVLGL